MAGTPPGSSDREEVDGSPVVFASIDDVTVDGDGNDNYEGDESSTKLERSRPSAREKFRYQYLDNVVDARKQVLRS